MYQRFDRFNCGFLLNLYIYVRIYSRIYLLQYLLDLLLFVYLNYLYLVRLITIHMLRLSDELALDLVDLHFLVWLTCNIYRIIKLLRFIIENEFILPSIHYASPAFAPSMSNISLQKLQRLQNQCLRITTGCVKKKHIQNLHAETST